MDLTYYAYKCFLDSFIGSSDCANFLKEIMPDGFCESIYDKFWDKLDYDSIYFIRSFIKMCGLSKQEIPQFDRFLKSDNCFDPEYVLYGHNDLYKFEIEYSWRIEYNNYTLKFYRNDGKHFLTLKTYLNRSGMADTVERYDWLVRQHYNSSDSDKPKIFYIGASCGYPKKYGFYVIVTGNAYFCPYEHEETLSPDEDFKEFYESIKEARWW